MVSGDQARELSLNNRNWVQLVALAPGISHDVADQAYVGTTNPDGQPNSRASFPWNSVVTVNFGQADSKVSTASDVFLISGYGHMPINSNVSADNSLFGWRLPQWPNGAERIVFAANRTEGPNLLTPTQQVVAILVGIVTTMLAILNAFFAWQVYRRAKAQDILLQLQIAKIRLEMAELAKAAERAREQEKSSIILLS